MTEFPSSEADELVTKEFLRAELALTRCERAGRDGRPVPSPAGVAIGTMVATTAVLGTVSSDF